MRKQQGIFERLRAEAHEPTRHEKIKERDISKRLKPEKTKEGLRMRTAYSGTAKEIAAMEEAKVALSDLYERSEEISAMAETRFYAHNKAGKALLSFKDYLNKLDLQIEEGVWLDNKFPITLKAIGGGWLECTTLGYAKGSNGQWCLMIETFRGLPEDEGSVVPSWKQVVVTNRRTVLSAPLPVQIAALKWMGCLITEIRERADSVTKGSQADEAA